MALTPATMWLWMMIHVLAVDSFEILDIESANPGKRVWQHIGEFLRNLPFQCSIANKKHEDVLRLTSVIYVIYMSASIEK
jgi:hypothetical protein